MGPHFLERFDRDELYKVCTYAHQFSILVRLHPNPLLYRRVNVHWVNDLKRSLACTGTGCQYCVTIGKEPRCYVPGMEWHNKGQRWVRRVVPVNASCLWVLDEIDLPLASWLCDRAYAAKNAPVRFKRNPNERKWPDVEDFDITKTLLRMWGVQTRVE